jgi:hypothetical protein
MLSCLPLVTHLVRSITTAHLGARGPSFTGVFAFEKFAEDGEYKQEAFERALKELEASTREVYQLAATADITEYLPELKLAISCGRSASAFCALFRGATERMALANKVNNLEQLKLLVADHKHRLIRIDLGSSHSYVVEQVDTRETPERRPQGNVYQSNIAVYGLKDRACTVEDFLANSTKPNPIDLLSHLASLEELGANGMPERRFELYKELYVTPGFLKRNDPPDGTKTVKPAFASEGTPLAFEVRSLSWGELGGKEERRARRIISSILSYAPILAARTEQVYWDAVEKEAEGE